MPSEPPVRDNRRQHRQHHSKRPPKRMQEIADPEADASEDEQTRHCWNKDELAAGKHECQGRPGDRRECPLLKRILIVAEINFQAVACGRAGASIASAKNARLLAPTIPANKVRPGKMRQRAT